MIIDKSWSGRRPEAVEMCPNKRRHRHRTCAVKVPKTFICEFVEGYGSCSFLLPPLMGDSSLTRAFTLSLGPRSQCAIVVVA